MAQVEEVVPAPPQAGPPEGEERELTKEERQRKEFDDAARELRMWVATEMGRIANMEDGPEKEAAREAMLVEKTKLDVERCNTVGETGSGVSEKVVAEPFHVIETPDGKTIEYYPWGVVRLRGFVSHKQVEDIYTECNLGGGGSYQRDQIHENEDGHPDQIYNKFAGHANMCLHWNYYNGPVKGQGAPKACLGPGDAAFREFREKYYDEAKWMEGLGLVNGKKGLSALTYTVHHRHMRTCHALQ